jgi:hypothetical protein
MWRAVNAHNEGLMEFWRFCRPMIADSHHFDEEQEMKSLTQIRMK